MYNINLKVKFQVQSINTQENQTLMQWRIVWLIFLYTMFIEYYNNQAYLWCQLLLLNKKKKNVNFSFQTPSLKY